MTRAVLEIVPELLQKTSLKNITLIAGLGYSQINELRQIIDIMENSNIALYQNIDNMPELMSQADIAITANGRTVYELAAMGIPTLSIAQNDRETLHTFARYHKGVKYLGMANNVDQRRLLDTLMEVATNNELRKLMYQAQIKDGNEIRKGSSKVIDEIFLEYLRRNDDRNKNW